MSSSPDPPLVPSPTIHTGRLEGWPTVNRRILERFAALADAADTRRSHFFAGRYENLYIARERIPEVLPVLTQATLYAARILGLPAKELRSGFWFNRMEPGQATLPHRHDDLDELLSGVYYVEVPEHSGDLVIRSPHLETRVTPLPGLFVFFPPDAEHEVSENRSAGARLSMAFNFGPLEDGEQTTP